MTDAQRRQMLPEHRIVCSSDPLGRDGPRQTIGAHRETINLGEGVAPCRLQRRLLAVEQRRMKHGRLFSTANPGASPWFCSTCYKDTPL